MKYVSKNRSREVDGHVIWGFEFESQKHTLNINLCLNTQITLNAFIDGGPLSINPVQLSFLITFYFF